MTYIKDPSAQREAWCCLQSQWLPSAVSALQTTEAGLTAPPLARAALTFCRNSEQTPQNQAGAGPVYSRLPSKKVRLQTWMEETAVCWPPAILGHPRGHTNSRGPQVSTLVNHCGPSGPVKSLPFMAQRPASSTEQADQVPLPGYHGGTVLVPCGDTPPTSSHAISE